MRTPSRDALQGMPFFMAVAVGTVNWLTERLTAPAPSCNMTMGIPMRGCP